MDSRKRILSDITSFIFIEDQPAPADIIFLPGSASPEPAERAAELFRAGFAPLILPSGRFSYKKDHFSGPCSKREIYSGSHTTEWEFLRGVLIQNGVPEAAILREDRAAHTVDNAFLSKQVLESAGITVRKAILCCRSFHARRALMTYGWAFPGVEFLVCPADALGIGRENWHRTEAGREKVLGEVSKCGSYFRDVIGEFEIM